MNYFTDKKMKATGFFKPYDEQGRYSLKATGCGVYIIKREGKVVYVGMSRKDVRNILYRHFQVWTDRRAGWTKRNEPYDRVTYAGEDREDFTVKVIFCKGAIECEIMEQALILKLKPKDNSLKRKSIGEVAEIELQIFNTLQKMIEEQKPNNSTETAILPMQCYVQCGDNLEFLKSQPNESVNMIYCDILYGTGRNFGDYQDLKPIRSEIESHYLPRLIEMKRVLKSTGSIYLQMDTKINHWVRLLMDEVFGYDNFRNEISWCYNSQGKTTKQWNKKHDVILYYTKSEDYIFNSDIVKDSISDLTYRRFQKEIDKYGYYTVLKNGKRTQYTLADGSLPKDWFEDITYISRDNKELTGYPTQKPKELIKRFILASTNEGDVVADYYLGSGTTAVVCKELNRNFIGCDLNPKAIEITKARLNGGQ